MMEIEGIKGMQETTNDPEAQKRWRLALEQRLGIIAQAVLAYNKFREEWAKVIRQSDPDPALPYNIWRISMLAWLDTGRGSN